MPSITDLFKSGGTAEQFLIWSVLNTLVSGALAPAISDITQGANSADPVNPLSPQQLAVLVARQILEDGSGPAEAAKSGIGPGRFQQLVALAESPAELGLILQGARRALGQVGPGMDAHVNLDDALADLGISSQYRPLVKASVFIQPSAADVLNAWLEGQIGEAEAVDRLKATGLDPTWIQTAYNANGQAPTPVQALEMLNRRLIPLDGTGPTSVSYKQAFLEGPWRNKWEPVFEGLRNYLPPPRTIQAMHREGTIDLATATDWLQQNGVTGAVLTAFLKSSTHAATPAQRELSKTEVVELYGEQLITAGQAETDLVALGYSTADAHLIIAGVDKKAATAATKQAVTRLKNLFLGGTNDVAATRAALTGLGLPDAQISNLLATWHLEQATTVRVLTPAQIEAAWYYNLLDTQTALAGLRTAGYNADDALLLLGIRNHAALNPAQLAGFHVPKP